MQFGAGAGRTRPTPLWLYGVVAICSASLVTLGLVLYLRPATGPAVPPSAEPGAPATQVEVVGFDLIISYWTTNRSDTSYFQSPECESCPTSLAPSSEWKVGFLLTNSDKTRGHEVTNLTLGAPFALTDVQPRLPWAVTPGGSVDFQVLISLPAAPGSYFLPGSIGTS